MKLPASVTQNPMRSLVLASGLASTAMLAAALIGQYGFNLHPCELCLAQRVPYTLIALLGLWAAVKTLSPQRLRLFVLLCGVLFAVDSAIAVYHSAVEFGFIKGPSACTNSETGEQTLEQMRAAIRNAQLVPCDQPMAYFFGLSMATWNALAAAGMAVGVFFLRCRIGRKSAGSL